MTAHLTTPPHAMHKDSRDVNMPLAAVMALSFLPYLNLGPLSLPSQVQPWAALLAWLWVAVRAARHGLHLTGIQWTLILFAIWFMVYVYAGDGFDLETYFRRSAAFLLSAGIFLAARYLTPATLWRALKVTLPLWLAFAVLRYVSPGTYFDIVTPLVPTVVNSTARGTSSLAPEATDFGFTMAVMLVLCMITRQRLREQGEKAEQWPLWVAIVCALLSQSGTGYFGLALVGLIYFATRSKSKNTSFGRVVLAFTVAVPTVLLIRSLPPTGIRGIDLLITAFRSPGDLMDTTVSYRIAHNYVGYLGMIDSDFQGFGAGSFINEAPTIYSLHSLSSFFNLNEYYGASVLATLSQSPISQFGVIMLEFGIVGVVYIIILFTFALRSQIPYRAIAVALLITTWLNSFPIGWPPFWVLIGVMMSPHFRTQRAGHAERSPVDLSPTARPDVR